MTSPWKSGSDTEDDWRERAWNSSLVVLSPDEHVHVRLVRGRFILEQDDVSLTAGLSASDERPVRG